MPQQARTNLSSSFGHLHLQLRKGDTFQTRGAMRTVEFKVMAIATATEDEAEYCYVNEDTEILCEEGETLKVRIHDAVVVAVAEMVTVGIRIISAGVVDVDVVVLARSTPFEHVGVMGAKLIVVLVRVGPNANDGTPHAKVKVKRKRVQKGLQGVGVLTC